MTATAETPEETAANLTDPQRRALIDCISQDPTGERSPTRCGRSRALPVDCDRRSRGALLEAECLGWSEGFDNACTITPHGRAVAAILKASQ